MGTRQKTIGEGSAMAAQASRASLQRDRPASARVGLAVSIGGLAVFLIATPSSLAQFGTPGATQTRERLSGTFVLADGTSALESGDQVAVFFEDNLAGVFTITGDPPSTEFSFVVFGDNPDTTNLVEGPAPGDEVEFRFFDASTNSVSTNVQPLNAGGENFNYRYGGEVLPPIPDGFPIDLTPTTNIDLRIGSSADNGGGGDGGDGGGGDGGDGGGSGGASPDVDGDGKITTKDAALVLRFVVGSAAAGVTASQADITGDGRVDTDDAIAILRAR